MLGYPTQAVQEMENTLAHARELDNPNSVGITLLFSAQLFQLRREPEAATTQAEEALAVCAEHGLPVVELWCLLPRGWAAAYRGDVSAGIADIRESMDRRRSMGMGAVWPWFFALLAEAQGLAGQVDDGLSSLEEALGWVERNDERLYEAEVHRLRGELLLTRDTPDAAEAEDCFQQALTISRKQHAKSWELRAAMSMGRLWQRQGRLVEARELVAPVYGWFTEGFDTADLSEAKALLAKLS
jgi:predicted ATPase